MRFRSPSRPLACSLLLACALGCSTPGKPTQERTPPSEAAAPAPPGSAAGARPAWTQAFLEEAFLIASEVRIEGPVGLLEHVVVVQDPENHQHVVRSVPEGLLQETIVQPGSEDFPIRCQLDQLEIAADARVVVLERIDRSAVTVEARGDAYWRHKKTGEERRGATLRLVGESPR